MATQYSNRQFFRKTPNQYLAQFFASRKIPLNIDINKLNETAVEELQGALNALPDVQKAEIEAHFQDVNALACEGGIAALADEANFHDDKVFVEAIAAIKHLNTLLARLSIRFGNHLTEAY